MEEQLSKKGKDPHFGAEKTLYRLQEQLLEVTGPLTCLWSDLTRPDGEPSKEQMVHLLQRTLVQVGSTSQAINIERRKIAWGRINPGMKTLAKEPKTIGKTIFLGQAFLRKHQRRLTRPSLRSSMMGPTHERDQLTMIPRISAIFCSKVPRLSAAARGSNASSSRSTPTPRRTLKTRSRNQPSIHRNRYAAPSSCSLRPCVTSRESFQLSRQLETYNSGPLGPTGGTRLPYRVDQTSQ